MATLITDNELNKLIMMCPDEKEPYLDPVTMTNKDGTLKYAYVTLVMLGDLYIAGAIVLAYSIRKCGSTADLVVLVTPDVSEEGKNILRAYFTHVIEVKYVEVPNWRTKKQTHRKYLELVFTKFHVFNLTQYEKILLIDADALVLKYPDHLFTLDTPAGCFLEDKDLIISYDKAGNYVLPKNGVFEWYNKYCKCCSHGNKIPKEMTDRVRTDSKNSGVGGGLILLEPKKGEFESIMNDITKFPMKHLIENKFVWPEQQYLTLRYSGKWSSINPRFFGLQGYPHWKILYGLQYGGDKPFVVNSKFDIKIRIQYPDFVLWHQFYGEILEKHPSFSTSNVLKQANELYPYFLSVIKAQKNMVSRINKKQNEDNSMSNKIIRKVFRTKHSLNLEREQSDYLHLDIGTEYNNVKINPMWDDVREYNYFEPISKLSAYYGESSYYNKLIKLYSEFNAHKVGRLDEQFPIDIMDPNDRDLIMLEYVKCRPNIRTIIFWPIVTQKLDVDQIIDLTQKYGNICYIKTITLTKNAIFNLMFWLNNEFTFGSRFDVITRRIQNMQFSNSNEVTVVFCDIEKDNILKINNIVTDVINMISLKLGDIKNEDLLKISNHFYQTIEHAKIILNENTLKVLELQNINNIINPHMANANLKIQTLKKWNANNLSQLESGRIVTFGDVILYAYGFRNIDNVNIMFVSVGNDNSQSEQELIELFKDTKIPFLDFEARQNELDNTLSYFDIEDLLEVVTDPKYYFYYQGLKCMLLVHEMVRKIYKNEESDKADFIMTSILYPEIVSEYVQLHNEKLEFKINNKTEMLSHEDMKKLFRFIYKKYMRDDIDKIKKILDNNFI